MRCPRCGMAMRDGVRHGATEGRTNHNYLDGIKPGRKAGPIFICSDGCWYEVEKVRCAVCPNYLTRRQQRFWRGKRGRFCSRACAHKASKGQPKPRRAGLP